MIGIESSHGFGDILFNIPLIRAIRKKHNYDRTIVAVRQHCKDALFNIPDIDKIVQIDQMGQGFDKLKNEGCHDTYQITQNVKFYEFRQQDHNHSLIHTPLLTGKQLGCDDFDNRPIFIPTEAEYTTTSTMVQERPTIAIESVYTSQQSWANDIAISSIVEKYQNTHRILWLSNTGAPNNPSVDNMMRFTRRECLMCLRACDLFFSVGSGFFCGSLALPAELQPRKIICLWDDTLYKYEEPIAQYNWHPDITWVHNYNELQEFLVNGKNN